MFLTISSLDSDLLVTFWTFLCRYYFLIFFNGATTNNWMRQKSHNFKFFTNLVYFYNPIQGMGHISNHTWPTFFTLLSPWLISKRWKPPSYTGHVNEIVSTLRSTFIPIWFLERMDRDPWTPIWHTFLAF